MPRSRFQFSIRDLMFIMAGCAAVALVLAQADRRPWIILLPFVLFFVGFFSLLISRSIRSSRGRKSSERPGMWEWIPPPPGLDRELYVTGQTGYDSATLARTRHNAQEFRIAPDTWAWWKMAVVFAAAAVALGGIWAILQRLHVPQVKRDLAVLAVGIAWLAGLTIVAVWWRKEQRRGPWLIYNKKSCRIRLPRLQQEFDLAEVVHLQYVTTENPDRKSPDDQQAYSELNLVTQRNGRRQRWHLLRADATFRPLERLLHPLLKHTPLPVVRIQGHSHDWEVTIAPYHE